MRLVLLTPGTGNFHCGSCLHDEPLAKALRAQGHDASIVGLYLPLVLDDPAHRDAVDPEPQMGGINLYLQQKSPVFRHTPAFVDRLLDRPALLGKAANRADLTSARELGTMTVEMLRGEHGKTAKELHRLLAHLQTTGAPDVVLLNNALLLSLAGPIKRALGCVVACTLQGEDTFLDGLPQPWRQQAWSLVTEAAREADLLLPVSAYHAGIMRDRLSLPADKVRVVHNGIDTDGMQPADPPAAAPAVGYLARMTRSKGVFTLIDAFEAIAPHQPDAKLILVGTATPTDRKRLDERLDALPAGLRGRVEVHPNVTRAQKLALLKRMSVLSVPATYGESFGLYMLEANAMGVPVVQPDHAAFPEVIAATGGGILYDHEDPAGLTDALAALLPDAPRRAAMGRAGRAAVLERFTAAHMAARTIEALEAACPARSR